MQLVVTDWCRRCDMQRLVLPLGSLTAFDADAELAARMILGMPKYRMGV